MKNRLCRNILIAPIIIAILYIAVSTAAPIVHAESKSKMIQGELDLQDIQIANDGPFELQGEWDFYWDKLFGPEDNITDTPEMVTVPDPWSHYTYNGGTLPRHGYATYGLTININEADVGRIFSFYMPSIATSYRFWVNDQLLTSVGQVGETRDLEIPGDHPKVVTFKADSPQIELLLQVSNFHQRKSGQWETITFGTDDQITELREKNILFQVFVIGAIFIIGFYHFVMFLQRPKELSPLYLAVACFSVVLRTLLLKDKLILYLIPNVHWEVAVALEYISALIALLFFLLFVRREFPFHVSRYVIPWFIGMNVIYICFILVTPARIFTNSFTVFQAFFFITMLFIVLLSFIGVLRKSEGAYLSFFAMLVLFAAVLNDLLYYSNRVSTDEFVSLGLLFYLFTQSIHLARKSSRSFDNVERLSSELKEMNVFLEQKVEKRTVEIRYANISLQKMEQSRRRLLASVSHELNTPLTFIQGYIKAMLDGVVSKDDSTYLRTVYSDTQLMAHLIRDLQELSKLESGQVTFQFEDVDIERFVSQLSEEQKPIMEQGGLHLLYEGKTPDISDGMPITCSIDPVRIKQAFLNLIINAQKFTPVGGTIKVDVEIPSSDHDEQIKVSVSDTGTGIAGKDLPYIFERFYKENKKKNGVKQGAGLGLAIVKEIIEQHKGSVGATSEVGKGSTFFFTLPVKAKRREL